MVIRWVEDNWPNLAWTHYYLPVNEIDYQQDYSQSHCQSKRRTTCRPQLHFRYMYIRDPGAGLVGARLRVQHTLCLQSTIWNESLLATFLTSHSAMNDASGMQDWKQVRTINSYRKDDVSILSKHQKCGRTNSRYSSCIILAPTGDGGSKVQDMVTCTKATTWERG